MSLLRTASVLLVAFWLLDAPASRAGDDETAVPNPSPKPQEVTLTGAPGKLVVTVGKSLIIDSPTKIQRVSVANGELVETVAVNPMEVLLNGKAPGETSLIVWQDGGNRLLYDLTVRMSPLRLDSVRQQLARDFPSEDINITFENDTAFVRGTVKDVMAADRVMAIVATLAGKGGSVNLLRVEVPPVEQQIMLKVRFCNVERTLQTDLGLGLASGAFNQATSIGTGQYSTPSIDNNTGLVSIANALNIMMFRKDINLAATIKALEARSLLETLAEPNLLAINGKEASFVAGGEFPFPMIQPGIGGNTVTIAFREFGIRIKFLPRVTTRGTIQLQVAPEVSSLDYGHLVNVSGTSIPAMATRRVQTEVELESGQSFVIGGLMDNSLTETISKIPGLANIPLLGKLFTSRSYQRNNSELLVIVTPELVRPIPAGQPLPALTMKGPFLPRNSDIDMHQPGIDKTGPVPVKPPVDSIPVEQLVQQRKEGQAAPQANPQFLIVQAPQALANPNPGLAPSPASGGTAK